MLGIVFGVFFRAYNLSFPNKQVFDEVYFPVFANNYLHHVYVYDVHPPLGKFLIAIGIAIFGNVTFGWRIIPLIFGLSTIPLMGYLWYRISKDKIGAWLMAFFIAIDGIFIVYSRTGLMDGILFFFIFLTLLSAINLKKPSNIFWVVTLLGLTAAIKWVGLAILIPVIFLAWRQKKLKQVLIGLPWSLAIYSVTVMAGEALNGAKNWLASAITWNQSAWHYHLALKDTHPYSSPWWSWPLLKKPVLFLYDSVPGGLVQAITTRGNTILWWTATMFVIVSLVYVGYRLLKERDGILDHPLVLLLLGYGACLLPFIPVHRVLFIYHYMPAYGFALMMTAYWLAKLWRNGRGVQWAIIALTFLLLCFSVYSLPIVVGWISVPAKWALMWI